MQHLYKLDHVQFEVIVRKQNRTRRETTCCSLPSGSNMPPLSYNRAFSQNNNISYQCVLLSMGERIDKELTYLFYPRSSDHKSLSGSAYGTSLTNSVDPCQTVPVSRLIRDPHRLPVYASQ